MKILNRTFKTPEQNLACDEALLDAAEEGLSDEVLRFWSPDDYFVVLGYSGKIADDVELDACRAAGVPVLRRASGGGTVLQGPGCLNYSLVLSTEKRKEIPGIVSTNHFIMERQRQALLSPSSAVEVRGVTDLAVGGKKFSGNAQRRKKKFVLFHGTFLLDFDLDRISRFLKIPPRQPDYRRNRTHRDFLANFPLFEKEVREKISAAWNASEDSGFDPEEKMKGLVESRYSKEEWNFKF